MYIPWVFSFKWQISERNITLLKTAKQADSEHYSKWNNDDIEIFYDSEMRGSFYDGCTNTCVMDLSVLRLSHHEELEEAIYGKVGFCYRFMWRTMCLVILCIRFQAIPSRIYPQSVFGDLVSGVVILYVLMEMFSRSQLRCIIAKFGRSKRSACLFACVLLLCPSGTINIQ